MKVKKVTNYFNHTVSLFLSKIVVLHFTGTYCTITSTSDPCCLATMAVVYSDLPRYVVQSNVLNLSVILCYIPFKTLLSAYSTREFILYRDNRNSWLI